MGKIFDYIKEVRPASDYAPLRAPPTWAGLIVHHTTVGADLPKSMSPQRWLTRLASNIGWLTLRDKNYLSAHFLIGREGEIIQLVDPRTHVAYHAGISSYFHPARRQHVGDWNNYAIGIELLGDGNKGPYSDAQYAALIRLSKDLYKTFRSMDPRCITGHENLTGRKDDPGRFFDWRRFFEGVFK